MDRFKTFANAGTLLPGDLNSIQDLVDSTFDDFAPDVTVMALPTTSLVDGQIVYYTDPTKHITWKLRYNAAGAAGKKWEPTGLPVPLTDYVDADETTASDTFVNLATVGPTITVPLPGDYLVMWGAGQRVGSTGEYARMGISIDGATPTVFTESFGDAGRDRDNVMRSYEFTLAAAGDTIQAKYRLNAGGGAAEFQHRWISAFPLRVG